MLTVLFFGQLKEVVQINQLQLEWPLEGPPAATVSNLRCMLQNKGENWQEYLAEGKALVAVNQTLVNDETRLNDHDEVAFFPPVTGG